MVLRLELAGCALTVGVLPLSMMQWVAADSKANVALYPPLFLAVDDDRWITSQVMVAVGGKGM